MALKMETQVRWMAVLLLHAAFFEIYRVECSPASTSSPSTSCPLFKALFIHLLSPINAEYRHSITRPISRNLYNLHHRPPNMTRLIHR